MACGACGHENPSGARFCLECGARLAFACPRCGTELPGTAKFCLNCGAPVGDAPPIDAIAPAPAAPAPALPPSFCDGRYEVKKLLGEGGKKRVYLAHDTLLDRDVAFALIKTDGLDDEGRERVRREAQAMGRLGAHPHVVSVFDFGELPSAPSQPYIVTELMDGGDVKELIERAEQRRVPLTEALRIAEQVCRGLEFAHEKGIVHRDLKPGNVWLTGDGTAKIGDFGLAVATDRVRLTQAGMMVGTVSYMPPEQAIGGDVTPRSDLYSLGAMLYELVTGRPPFLGDESVAIITQHLNTPPVAPSWHVPDLPAGLEALILRLLEKDASKRPASATEVTRILAAAYPSPQPSPARGERVKSPLPLGEGESVSPGPEPLTPSPQSPIYRRIFVGREQELRQLQAAFDAAMSGQGALLMVVGEPGIGKTALCEQLATYTAVRGGKTLVGHCYEEGSLSLPYLAFVEAMRTYVLDREPEGLRQDLGSGAQEVARIVSEIRQRLSLDPTTQHSALSTQHSPDPDEDRWRLLQAVVGFLRNASSVQPLLLVLEDLHWADRGTLDLLLHLSRALQGSRLLVVGTYRDVEVDRSHPLSAALAELRRVSTFDRVLLRGLTAEAVQRMLAAIAGQGVSWSFAEAVHRQTEGNPLFVQEVVRYLVEEGLVVHEGGHWQRSGQTPLEMHIPEGLRDVIGKRISRLSAECNQVLSVAAVIGRDFTLETLQLLGTVPEEPLLSALEEAVHVGVLEDQSRAGSVRFRFSHAFFRQTLYEEIFTPRRLRLHQDVARALERQYGARLEEHAAELAEHFSQSSDPADLARAVKYSEAAARRAMGVYAHAEAARHWEQALLAQEVLDPDDRATRCDLLLELGEALGPAGEPLRAAEQVAPEALRLAEALGDGDRAAQVCELAINALHRHGGDSAVMTDSYLEWAQRWDRHAPADTRARAYADCVIASALRPRGSFAEANGRLLRGFELARRLDEPEVLSRAAASMMFPSLPMAFQEEQIRIAYEFTGRPREGVRTSTLALVLLRAQTLLLVAGDRDRAERVWQELDRLAAQTRDVVLLLWPLQGEAVRATLGGDLEGALSAATRLIERAQELGIPGSGLSSAGWLTLQPLLHLGRPDEALPFIGVDQVLGTYPWFVVKAILATGSETAQQLNKSFASQRQLAEQGLAPAYHLTFLLEAAVLAGDAEAAAFCRGQLAGLVAAASQNLTLLNVARQLGAAAALLGDREAARREYARSLEWTTKIRHRPEIALTRLGLAELLLDEAVSHQQSAVSSSVTTGGGQAAELRAEALAHLDFAIEEFRAMKMQPSLERALRHKGLLTA